MNNYIVRSYRDVIRITKVATKRSIDSESVDFRVCDNYVQQYIFSTTIAFKILNFFWCMDQDYNFKGIWQKMEYATLIFQANQKINLI